MGLSSIQPVIQLITIDTMLNNNGPNISDGLNSVVCEQTLWLLSVKLTLEEILEIVQCLLKNSNRFEEKNSMFPIAYSEFERDRTLHTAVGNGTGTTLRFLYSVPSWGPGKV